MMQKLINKHWNVLQINSSNCGKHFRTINPFVAFKRNKYLQEIIGGHMINNRKVFKAHSEKEKNKM